jgi:hypothetical protein
MQVVELFIMVLFIRYRVDVRHDACPGSFDIFVPLLLTKHPGSWLTLGPRKSMEGICKGSAKYRERACKRPPKARRG